MYTMHTYSTGLISYLSGQYFSTEGLFFLFLFKRQTANSRTLRASVSAWGLLSTSQQSTMLGSVDRSIEVNASMTLKTRCVASLKLSDNICRRVSGGR